MYEHTMRRLQNRLNYWRRHFTFFGALVPILMTVGCPSTEKTPTLSIFAAASLTEPFQGLAKAFEEKNRPIRVQLNFAGSQILRFQIAQGAPADVFASANADHLNSLLTAQKLNTPQEFAGNRLAIIVPKGAGSPVSSPATLAKARRLVLGTEASPIGQYSRQYLRRADRRFGKDFYKRVLAQVASLETNVRQILTRVELGAADAGMVYETDALRSNKIKIIPIPIPTNVVARYSLATVTRTKSPKWAQRWQRFVLSDMGQQILVRHGFISIHDTP